MYDTGTRSVRDFIPKSPGQAGIYLCGLTVQSGPHIGHLRSGVNYDVLRRWLEHSGYQVRFVRNITDIDDKVLAKALEQERPFWSIAYENELVLAGLKRVERGNFHGSAEQVIMQIWISTHSGVISKRPLPQMKRFFSSKPSLSLVSRL